MSDAPAPSVPPPAPPAPPPPAVAPIATRGRALSALQIVGLAIIGGAVLEAAGLIVPVSWQTDLIAAVIAGGGAWLVVRPWATTGTMVSLVLALVAGGVGFGMGWPLLSWPGLGAGAGCAANWGFAQRKRGAWFTVAAFGACYVVAGVAALVQCSQGHGVVWVFIQGLASMLVGAVLYRQRSEVPAVAFGLRLASRGLLVAGLILPYAALLIMALRSIA